MLKSLSITNFRCFPKYHMPSLARVNLLVGKNNSGKTAVLEAVHFLVAGGNPRTLELAAFRRGEIKQRDEQNRREIAVLSHVFHDSRFGLGSQIDVRDRLKDQYATITLVEARADDIGRIAHPPDFLPVLSMDVDSSSESHWPINKYALDEQGAAGYSLKSRVFYPGSESDPFLNEESGRVLFLDSGLVSSGKFGAVWRKVVMSRKETVAMQSLSLLDSNLEDPVFLGAYAQGNASGRDGLYVGTKGARNRVPLGSMGEGTWRILSLGAALAYCEGGTLLIDEIDSGLHYSLFEDFWAYVVRMAVDLNVQVFATTHSNDCLQALGGLCESKPELAVEVAVHKLNAGFDVSVPISGEKLPAVLDGGAEIR